MKVDHIGVHTTHCCLKHGCKYGDEDCPVITEKVKQKYLCEDCEDDSKEIIAAENMDWMQVVFHQGPPCFAIMEDGHFCGRAERWDGHKEIPGADHKFISLADLIRSVTVTEKEEVYG